MQNSTRTLKGKVIFVSVRYRRKEEVKKERGDILKCDTSSDKEEYTRESQKFRSK